MASIQIPWPKTALPGRHPGESQGTLVNAYAVQVGEEIRIRRTAGLRRYLTPDPTSSKKIPRGMLDLGTALLHAWDGVLMRRNEDGSNINAVGALPGSEPVTMARNLRQDKPDVVVVTQQTGALYYDIATNTLGPYPEDATDGGESVAAVESVEYYSGYFMFTRRGGTMIASDLQEADIIGGSTAVAEYVADDLYRTKNVGSALAVMGSKSTEFWVDVGSSPFPLQRQTSIDVGLLSPWAVAGGSNEWENGLLWVAGDWTVRMLNGFQAQPVSTDDVVNDIRNASMQADDLYAQVYVFNAQAIWSLSCSQWTWEYNVSTGAWHKRESYQKANWRGRHGCRFLTEWLAQDWHGTGCLFSISPNVFDEDGERLRWFVESAPLKEFPANVRVPSIDIDMTVGIGQEGKPSPFQTDPVVMVSWSHNGGANWSNPLARSMGKEGRYATKITVNNLGRSTHQGTMIRLEVVDPVWVQLTGAISTRTKPSRARGVNQ